jgi:hypothetical protein
MWLQMVNSATVNQEVTLFDQSSLNDTKMQTVYSYTIPRSTFPVLGGETATIEKNGVVTNIATPFSRLQFADALTAATGVTFVHYSDTVNSNELYYSQGAGSNVFASLVLGAIDWAPATGTKIGGTDIAITLISALEYNTFLNSLGMLESFYFDSISIQANNQAQLNQPVTMTKFKNIGGAKLTESFTPIMNRFQPQFVYDRGNIHFPVDGNNTFTYTVNTGETVLWRLRTKMYNVRKALGEIIALPFEPTVINAMEFLNRESYELFIDPLKK